MTAVVNTGPDAASRRTGAARRSDPRRAVALAALLVCIAILPAAAQNPPAPARKPSILTRWFRLGSDSVLVECCYPATAGKAPALVLLPDRFGVQRGDRQLAASLAQKGYRTFVIQLRSTPVQQAAGAPAVELFASDYDLVAQIAIDASNDAECNGRVGLLGFDAGATIGAEVARRLPVFKACVLFYPSSREAMMRILPELTVPVSLNVGSFDPEYTLANINDIREACMEKGRHIRANFFTEAKPFFFNLDHENYSKTNTVRAWSDALSFLQGALQ